MIACVVRQIYSTQGSIGQTPTHTGHRCNRDPGLPATWACLHIEIPNVTTVRLGATATKDRMLLHADLRRRDYEGLGAMKNIDSENTGVALMPGYRVWHSVWSQEENDVNIDVYGVLDISYMKLLTDSIYAKAHLSKCPIMLPCTEIPQAMMPNVSFMRQTVLPLRCISGSVERSGPLRCESSSSRPMTQKDSTG